MSDDELLRLDYVQTTARLSALTDIRFKLLAFVPTVAGAAVAVLAHPGSAAELLGVGLVGLCATGGIFLYELRNSELYRAALARAVYLERRLGMPSVLDGTRPGGLFGEQPPVARGLPHLAAAIEGVGLGPVYTAAIGGWSYLVAWGALRAAGASHAQTIGGIIGAVAAVATFAATHRSALREPAVSATPVRSDPV